MAKDKTKLIFPSDEIANNNISATVDNTDGIIMVQAYNLQEGDSVTVEYEFKLECESYWVQFRDCCGPVGITYPNNLLFLPIPLNYRFILTNVDDNHLTDPSWFGEVKLLGNKVTTKVDLSQFYHGCCNTPTPSDASICDLMSSLPKPTT